MDLAQFIASMPKVELHVHLEGSIRPNTVLQLARTNGIELPEEVARGAASGYQFRDFPDFVDQYVAISQCIRSAADLERVAREFVDDQADQHVLYTEATFTASTLEKHAGIPWSEQIAALNRAREYGIRERGVTVNYIIDIVRGDPPARAQTVAEWAKSALGDGVCALGLAGDETLPMEEYRSTFEWAHAQGLPLVAHAGETAGATSIRDALEIAHAVRIGHGVRCLEDPFLGKTLRDRQTPIEVCPSSNIGLGVFPDLARHPLPRMMDEGLNVSVNSDDPGLFGVSLTQELQLAAAAFDLNEDILWSLTLNAANAALIPVDARRDLIARLRKGFAQLEASEAGESEEAEA